MLTSPLFGELLFAQCTNMETSNDYLSVAMMSNNLHCTILVFNWLISVNSANIILLFKSGHFPETPKWSLYKFIIIA